MAKKIQPVGKALEALYEGRFFRKTGVIIAKRWHQMWKAIDFFLAKITRYFMMRHIKIQPNKVIFIPFQGDYSCNLKYITEELLRQESGSEIVWVVRKATLRHSDMYPSQIRFVEQYKLDYYHELASSKVWVVNSVDFLKRKVYKKPGQILIETWHGSLGIKRFDASVNAGRAWVRAARYCGKVADYCISNSEFEDNVFKGTFWANTPILRYGHPRNDVLLRSEAARVASERARDLLNLPEDTRLVLYAPTFRDNHQFGAYALDYARLCSALERRFGGNWMVITRFHPTVRKFSKTRGATKGCIDATGYDDIQELMCVADFGITDYSSWIYDFMLTRKPGIIFATDVEEYDTERGFYYSLTETPFPLCTTNDEVESAIASFDEVGYAEEVESFLRGKGCVEDGLASERVAEKITNLTYERLDITEE